MPDTKSQVSVLVVKVKGQKLQPADLAQIQEVTVEQDLFLPDSFMIRMLDVKDQPTTEGAGFFARIDKKQFSVGDSIEIKMGRETTPASVVKGEITSMDLEIYAGGQP